MKLLYKINRKSDFIWVVFFYRNIYVYLFLFVFLLVLFVDFFWLLVVLFSDELFVLFCFIVFCELFVVVFFVWVLFDCFVCCFVVFFLFVWELYVVINIIVRSDLNNLINKFLFILLFFFELFEFLCSYYLYGFIGSIVYLIRKKFIFIRLL